MHSAQVVTLKSGQQNASSVDSNRHRTHLSFVQTQHYRDALESRAIRKLNHKSEMVRIMLRRLEAFMRWVVVSLRRGQGWLSLDLGSLGGLRSPSLIEKLLMIT
jgi:hypothetical protein